MVDVTLGETDIMLTAKNFSSAHALVGGPLVSMENNDIFPILAAIDQPLKLGRVSVAYDG